MRLRAEHRHTGDDVSTLHQRRDDADLLVDAAPRAAAARGSVRVQRFDFLADQRRLLARRRTPCDAQPDFVRPRRWIERAPVQRGHADEVDSQRIETAREALFDDAAGELGSTVRVPTGVGDFTLADESGEIADAYLELGRTRPSA